MKSLIVFLVFLSIICSGISSASATQYVGIGASNNDIQQIIDNAQAGDTIQFTGSEYDNLSLIINKTLNLVGAPTGTVIKSISDWNYIPSSVKGMSINNTAAFYFLNTVGCSISGFNITNIANSASDIGSTNSLIYAKNATGLNIYNNNLNFSSFGVYAYLCPNVVINNNTASNMNNTGILSFGSLNALISNNTVLNCSNHGIDVRHPTGANVTVCGNVVNDANEGIYLMHSAGHDVYNNTILNCALSSISAYGAGDININNNTMINSPVGVLLASGFYNVTIQNNSYKLKPSPSPPTPAYPIVIDDTSTGSSGTFTDSGSQVSSISMSSSYSSSSITNGKSTTYTVKVSNNGKGPASDINITKILPSSNYTNCNVVAVSKGSFNAATGTWNVGSLSSGSDALIVFTVTAKKAGSLSTIPSASYIDHGNNSLNASSTALTINKDIKNSYSYAISKTKVKKGSYFYVTVTAKNSGLDTSGLCTIQDKLSSAFSKLSTSQTSPFKYSSSKWTGTIGSGKTITLKMKIKMNKKGKYTLPVIINGKTLKTYTVTGY